MKSKPKILVWDLETGFNQANIFSLYDTKRGIPHTAIQRESYIICGSFKWLENGKPFTYAINPKRPTDDKAVVKKIHKLLSKADAVVAHYGDAYDLRFFNMRALYHGLEPVHPMVQIDTYKIAKKHFRLNSNRLDYLGQFLNLGGKDPVSRELWQRCYDGDEKAINKMVRYCEQDVRLLEKVYLKLRPYTPAKLNFGHFSEGLVCPSCGSEDVHKRGYYYTRVGKFQKWQCQECGNWSSSRASEKDNKPEVK